MPDLAFACRCGAVHGRLVGASPKTGLRIVCYCADCQAYLLWLGVEAMDAYGGTQIFQTLPHRFQFENAAGLACMRMTRGGPLRWRCDKCQTPIANTTAGPGIAFSGLVEVCANPAEIDAALGPVAASVFRQGARGERPKPRGEGGVPKSAFGAIRRAAWARLTGRWRETPFFGPDKRPIREPETLSEADRRRVYDPNP